MSKKEFQTQWKKKYRWKQQSTSMSRDNIVMLSSDCTVIGAG